MAGREAGRLARGRDRPTRQGGRPRAGRAVPAPTHGGEADDDITELGLRDMAGNGREWTRAVLRARGQAPEEVREFRPGDLVILRGRNYTLPADRPLTYETIERERRTDPQTQFADRPNEYTGFRVVVPVSEK